MREFRYHRDADGHQQVEVGLKGAELLNVPLYNKGSAFSKAERRAFQLEGLLPSEVNSMERQVRRVYSSIKRKADPLEKYIGLAALQDRNEHLYFKVLSEHIEELMPIVYTPTVGLACKEYSNFFRRGRGVWITPEHRGRIAEVLKNSVRYSNVRLIVATDNSAILGIGDQGAGGMAISVGKLALYCAGAGIHPAEALPVSLDVGTNNRELLDNDMYLGWRHPRLTGEAYMSLIEEFVEAVQVVFPQALIQWEDFGKENAEEVLDRFRKRVLSFNDDVQGTGAVALAGVLSSGRVSGIPLTEQKVVIYGAGAAGVGIARQLRVAMVEDGLTAEQAHDAVAVLDSRGLLTEARGLTDYKKELSLSNAAAQAHGMADGDDLQMVVEKFKPTVLIGSSGQPGAFSEQVVKAMASSIERPLVMPFSNPTDCCEAQPIDLLEWTEGRCLVATGSPFEPVQYKGREYVIGQGNNVFIFPGLGLGALIAKSREVSDRMITVTARALAEQVHDADLECGLLYPAISRLREVSAKIAEAVVRESRDEGIGKGIADEDIPTAVKQAMWTPDYPEFVATEPN